MRSDFALNENKKLRGGYYTPTAIADFIVDWAIPDADATSLEPSCGDGAFIQSLSRRYAALGALPEQMRSAILGVELHPHEAEKAEKYGATIVNADFFSFYQEHIRNKRVFDAAVGNPPFIRYQNFEEAYRKRAFSLAKEAGIELNRLTNIWIPFLILSAECLSPHGRLGMVIPAELFQVDYAAETRKYLSEKFEHLIVITFNKLLFEGAQQEVALLLGEMSSERKGIEIYELNDSQDLKAFAFDANRDVQKLDCDSEKWVKYYLNNRELQLLKTTAALKGVTPTTNLFEVNVGVVSGQNNFFVMNQATRDSYRLADTVQPVIGRAEQLRGIQLDERDFQNLAERQKKVFLFTPDDVDEKSLAVHQREYIEHGEKQGYHKGFKCRNRKRWYIVPQSWRPEAFMLRQINRYPKIVLNRTEATNTDTLHKIRFRPGVNPKEIVPAFINSFTFAQCEVTGRSYGGGVMSFEPNEVRKLQIPANNAAQIDFERVDSLIREDKLTDALDYVDSIVLSDGLGLTRGEVLSLRGIWLKLSDRRIGRKGERLRPVGRFS